MTDRIVLSLPSAQRYRAVATLVLGGVGARLEIPYERVDDLQLAVLSAFDAASPGEVILEVEGGTTGLEVSVGPLRDGAEADRGLALVLSRLADEVEYGRRNGDLRVTLRLRSSGQ